VKRGRGTTAFGLAALLLLAGCGRKPKAGGDASSDGKAETSQVSSDVAGDSRADETVAPPPEAPDAGATETGAAVDGGAGGDDDARPDAGADALEPLPVCDGGVDGGGWRLLGAPNIPDGGRAWGPALAIDEREQPVLTWREGTTVRTSVWKDTGCQGAWQDLGFPAQGSSAPAVAVGAAGLMRAYLKNDTTQVIVERWNGTAFAPLGTLTDAMIDIGTVYAPAIVMEASGNPIVAWSSSLKRFARVARWEGAAWQMLTDAQGLPNSYVYSAIYLTPLSIALDGAGTPLVSWPGFGRKTGVAAHAGGTTWNSVATTVIETQPGATELSGPALRVSAKGEVFVASIALGGGLLHTTVFRLDNGVWTQLGTGPMTRIGVQDYDFALDPTGAPVLASSEGDGPTKLLFLYRWTGTSWEELSPSPPVSPGTTARTPRLAIDRHGRHVTAWVENTGGAGDSLGVLRVARTVR
jgi:hypothetical protein